MPLSGTFSRGSLIAKARLLVKPEVYATSHSACQNLFPQKRNMADNDTSIHAVILHDYPGKQIFSRVWKYFGFYKKPGKIQHVKIFRWNVCCISSSPAISSCNMCCELWCKYNLVTWSYCTVNIVSLKLTIESVVILIL